MYFKVTLVSKGKKIDRILEALNRKEATDKIKKEIPISSIVGVEEIPAPVGEVFSKRLKDLSSLSRKKVPIDQKISTIRQIAVMTDAGIAIHDTLEDVAENIENKRLKEIYYTMGSDINAGKSMSDSIIPFTEDFGHVAVAMTKLGESTGNFPESYHKLADILENIRDNVAKFKKAIRYPLITLTAMAIAFIILIVVVVPKFRDIFEQFNTELPVPTLILLAIEQAFRNYGPIILGTMLISVYLLIHTYKNNDKFKYWVDELLVHPKFYLIERVVFLSTMHKYTLVFGELVKSGIPVSEALETAVGMVDNLYIKEKLLTVNANIGRGLSLAESFDQTGLFENMLLQMIRAGEASGQLDNMLGKVTDYYDMRFQDIIDNLAAYIEPIMMFFIAGLVLLMALGIFLPMWDLGAAVKNA